MRPAEGIRLCDPARLPAGPSRMALRADPCAAAVRPEPPRGRARALQAHGRTRDFPLERRARGLRTMQTREDSSEIQRNIIAGLAPT